MIFIKPPYQIDSSLIPTRGNESSICSLEEEEAVLFERVDTASSNQNRNQPHKLITWTERWMNDGSADCSVYHQLNSSYFIESISILRDGCSQLITVNSYELLDLTCWSAQFYIEMCPLHQEPVHQSDLSPMVNKVNKAPAAPAARSPHVFPRSLMKLMYSAALWEGRRRTGNICGACNE